MARAVALASVCLVPSGQAFVDAIPNGISVRVAKALGSRGYNKVRVSLIRENGLTSESNSSVSAGSVPWTYQSQFQYKWTAMHLSSAIVDVQPGVPSRLDLDGTAVQVKIPVENEGGVGLIIADPCIRQSQWCPYSDVFNIKGTLHTVLNSLSQHNELDYWMNVGDLFYDQTGDISSEFFSGLSLQTQATVHGVSFGNHDFWNDGKPSTAQDSDNFGNGLMQWYAQDAMSAKSNVGRPFDFSINPSTHDVAHASNFFWYNKVGNVAFIGFSGHTGWAESEAYFQEACSWVEEVNPGLLLLLGHWDADNLGCASGMAAPEAYSKIMGIPGCAGLGTRVKYFEGHNHCNQITKPNTGFMVGAFGMGGCGDFGLPILDTRDNQATLWYFEMGSGGRAHSNFNEVLNCIQANGLSGCTHLATSWMNEVLPGPTPTPPPVPPPPSPPVPPPSPSPTSMVSITSKLSAKCLDITDGVEQNGAPLQVWTCDAGHPDFKQRWLLRGNEVVHEARFGGPDFCVDIPSNDQSDGNRLQIWQCLGTPQQQWQRTADSRLRIGGQCMDLTDGDVGDGVPVQIWECDGPTPQNQEWVFTSVVSEDMSTIVV